MTDLTELTKRLKDLEIAIENTKDVCDTALEEINRLRAQNDPLMRQFGKLMEDLKGLGVRK